MNANRITATEDGWVIFYCPGCGLKHSVPNSGPFSKWEWNGNEQEPTLRPALMVNQGQHDRALPQCHFYITAGKIEYQADCTHEFAGMIFEMEPVYDEKSEV